MFILIFKKLWFSFLLVIFISAFIGMSFYEENSNLQFFKTLNFYTSLLAMISPIVSYIMVRIASIKLVLRTRFNDALKEVKTSFDIMKASVADVKNKMCVAKSKKIPENDCRIFNDAINRQLSNIENKSLYIMEIKVIDGTKKIDIISTDIYKSLNKFSNSRDNEEALDNLYKEMLALETKLMDELNLKILKYV